jgi:hypothetical protein
MWTDMSEIVRPTRDGIHGREYISTSVDIGKKPSYLEFDDEGKPASPPSVVDIPMPMIVDMNPAEYTLPQVESHIIEAVKHTDLIAIIDSAKWPAAATEKQMADIDAYLPHIAFHLNPDAPEPPDEILSKTRMAEIPDNDQAIDRAKELKEKFPGLQVSIRVNLDAAGVERTVALANAGAEVIHVVADFNGDEIGPENVKLEKPRFIKDMIREIHTTLIKDGIRDETTIIAGNGIALPEHMAKALLCGADVISTYLPLLISVECRLCKTCVPGIPCPARLEEMSFEYGAGRMRNLIAAWHLQLIELMGAMGMREARRLRGDVGRAMFFEELEEEIFGTLFGSRKRA